MENKDREESGKKLAIIALIIALLVCSFGFAAYSRSVDIIENNGVANWVVFKGGVLSINPNKPINGEVFPTSTGGALADVATLTENGIIDINVHFTKPGQSATYSFFGINPTKEKTFLNSVVFGDRDCYAENGEETSEQTKLACEDITMNISVKDDYFRSTTGIIDEHVLDAESHEPISVTIKYSPKAHITSQGFVVDFGISNITYGQID